MRSHASQMKKHFRWRIKKRFHMYSKKKLKVIQETLLQMLLNGDLYYVAHQGKDRIRFACPSISKKCEVIFDRRHFLFVTALWRKKVKEPVICL